MQAIFIKKRIYPISYNKWIKEQFVDILKMPSLYRQLVKMLEIRKLESNELIKKSQTLRKLAKKYL